MMLWKRLMFFFFCFMLVGEWEFEFVTKEREENNCIYREVSAMFTIIIQSAYELSNFK
jgi:hypothetical protein